MTSTNYFNTLIEVAADCPAANGEIPPVRGDKKSVANLQFEMLHAHPYEFSSDDILFAVFATKKAIPPEELAEQRQLFFAKGQPCLRASPLGTRIKLVSDLPGRCLGETPCKCSFREDEVMSVIKFSFLNTKVWLGGSS